MFRNKEINMATLDHGFAQRATVRGHFTFRSFISRTHKNASEKTRSRAYQATPSSSYIVYYRVLAAENCHLRKSNRESSSSRPSRTFKGYAVDVDRMYRAPSSAPIGFLCYKFTSVVARAHIHIYTLQFWPCGARALVLITPPLPFPSPPPSPALPDCICSRIHAHSRRVLRAQPSSHHWTCVYVCVCAIFYRSRARVSPTVCAPQTDCVRVPERECVCCVCDYC